MLIVVDTLRADRLSTYGYRRATSPFLDGLAAEGTLFEDATAQSAWTLPSMVSLFTGRYLTDYRDFIAPEAPTLPEAFDRAGYRTIGIAGNILLTDAAGFARGFDHYDVRPAAGREPDEDYEAPDLDELLVRLEEPLRAALRTDEAGERPPVLLYLHPFDPHAPYDAYPHRPELREGLLGGARPGLAADSDDLAWQRWRFELQGPPAPAEDQGWSSAWWEIASRRDLYDFGVRHTDDLLAEAFAGWRAAGLLDDAVVALASDHGEGLWDHVDLVPPSELASRSPFEFFYDGHGSNLYQEAVHTPFFLWGRGVPRGRRIDTPIENVDLFPTLLELAGVAAHGSLHGHSLVPLMTRGEAPAREHVHSYVLHGTSLREIASGLELVEPTAWSIQRAQRSAELYDLAADPEERQDLASKRPEDVERLAAQLDAWRARYPTESTLGRRPDAARAALLDHLGYTGEHTGDYGAGSH